MRIFTIIVHTHRTHTVRAFTKEQHWHAAHLLPNGPSKRAAIWTNGKLLAAAAAGAATKGVWDICDAYMRGFSVVERAVGVECIHNRPNYPDRDLRCISHENVEQMSAQYSRRFDQFLMHVLMLSLTTYQLYILWALIVSFVGCI